MWIPQRGPQLAAIDADWCDEIFYGGQRGGGKSDFQLGYQEDGALRYGNRHRGIMFRKTYPELEELQARASEIFPGEGATYKTQPSAGFPFSNCWYWPSGATVKMRFIENEKDYGKYHGHQYTRISFDEVTEYSTPAGLLKMLSTLRSPYGVPCTMRATGNPGGIGHVWVKARYVACAPPMSAYNDPETGFTRMFVPSRMEDNAILMKADPTYRSRILAATGGNEALRKAWLEGDWDIVAGAFFDNWNSSTHVIPGPWRPPKNWTKYRSMDWGSARPFSVGWWCVVPDDTWIKPKNGPERLLKRGALVRYREWYGCKPGEPNTGLKLDAETVAKGIKDKEAGEDIDETMSPADPSMWKEDGGPSIAERMVRALPGNTGPRFRPADNTRIAGWQQVRARLNGEDDAPMLLVTADCLDFLRTFPAMQHDPNRIEDVDTDGEDHCFDADTEVVTADGPRRIADLVGKSVRLLSPVGEEMAGLNCRLTKKQAETIRVTFEDGTKVVCTPDHLFETAEGWTQARDLIDAIRYHGAWSKSSATHAKNLTGCGITSAAADSRETSTPRPRLAQCNAGASWQALRVQSVEPAGRRDVYCLTVPHRAAFMIEGGLSVHNCADEVRYSCMARPLSRVPSPRKISGPKPFSLDWVLSQR